MNQNFTKLRQFNISGIGCWLSFLLVCLLLGSVGLLKFVVNGVLIVLGFLFLAPIVAWLGFSWWLKRNLVEDKCPVCSYQFTGFNNTNCRCPSCQEPLRVEMNRFQRLTPPGTIDVEAVEVSAKKVEG